MIKIKDDEMSETCSTHETRNKYIVLVGKLEGRRHLGVDVRIILKWQ
jgi:hypothetical protein